MPRTCTICTHPNRAEIDRALVNNSGSIRDIARQFSVSRSALDRHKTDHLPAKLAQAKDAAEVAQADTLLEEMQKLQRATLSILGRTYASGDYRTALSAIREARGNLELLGRLLGELKEQQTTVNVLVTDPEWINLRTKMLRALENYPEARLAIAAAIRDY